MKQKKYAKCSPKLMTDTKSQLWGFHKIKRGRMTKNVYIDMPYPNFREPETNGNSGDNTTAKQPSLRNRD